LQLKVLINFFFFFFIIFIIITTIIVVVIVLLLTIIYTINLPVVRPRSCRVIYYFDTPPLGKKHQFFGRVSFIVFKDFFATFQRKQTILILDLYIYSIKIQTNIKKNS